MDVVNTILGKMLDPMIDLLFTPTWRQIGYVVHYKENIKNLEDEVEKLRDCMERVQEDAGMALDNGMVVEEDVSKWLVKVQRTLTTFEEVKKLLQDKGNLCCLDVCSRHQLGRKAKKKMMDVTGLKDEGKFQRVAHPSRLTHVWYGSTTNFEHFESRKPIFKEIMEALKDDSDYKIGIYGMPGVGKTTMAEEVGKQAEKELVDEVAMAVFSQNPDLRKIQGKLADCLNLTLKRESEEGRAIELCNRLKNGRKILVILDDVWGDQITLKKIGIPDHINNSKGCKILLTSRRLEVCNQMGFEKNFKIGLPSKPEAWQLFKRTVGDYIETDGEMLSVAGKVCRECDCLPLAILAVGAALKDEKEKHVWDDALEQLRNFQGHKIEGVTEKLYSRIEWSYSYLRQTNIQSCFLHCCLFGEDTEIYIENLVWYGMGTKFLESTDRTSMKKARDRTRVMVGILKKYNLLLEGENENFVKMHDVIRDVGISIASRDQNAFLVKDVVKAWPEKDDYKCCRTISLRVSHNVRRLPNQLDCRRLRTLVLECSTTNRSLVLPNCFFEGMEQLEVLHLQKMKLLPSSLSNLVNLRMLFLLSCEMENLSFLKELKNLEILIIGYNDFKVKKLVLEIEHLSRLRLLHVKCCPNNIIFPSGVLSHLSDLEELYLPDEFVEWDQEGNARIVELNSLTSLTTLDIHLPDSVILRPKGDLPRFKSLTRYRINIGNSSIREDLEYSKTKILGLAGIPLKVELNFLMENAEVLYFDEMEGLKKVLHDRDGEWFFDLKCLQVKKCDDMEHLLGKPHGPCPFGSFGKLSVLEVAECRLIKYLFSPSTARCLPKLQELNIKNCETLEEIVRGDVEVMDEVIFHQLKEMRLECLPNLRSIYSNTKKISTTECNPSTIGQALFNEKVTCPVLEKLYIERLNSITAIWDKQLLPVQEAEDSFEHLQRLSVKDCWKMEEIVAFRIRQREEAEAEANDEIAVFTQLKSMELRKLPSLKSFCIGYGSEKEETSEEGIPQIQALFNHKVAFPMLEELELPDGLLEYILHGHIPVSSLSKVRVLTVSYCIKLVKFPLNLLQRFQAVEKLNLVCCWTLEVVADHFNLEGLNAIERQGFLVFNNLTVMDVYGCDSLRYLFSLSIATGLMQLQRLAIKRCISIEEIVRNEEQGPEDARDKIMVLFPQLERLHLDDLPNLKSFCGPNNIAYQLPSLCEVQIDQCDKFWTTSGRRRKPVTSFFGDHLHKSLEKYISGFLQKSRPSKQSRMGFFWQRSRARAHDDDETNEDEIEGESNNDESDVPV